MKITIVGLGAVGGLLAVRLAQAGHDVQALARGATLQAVRTQGLRLVAPDGTEHSARIAVSDRVEALDATELVVVALKGPGWASVAPSLAPLLARGRPVVLPMMNGVPWWFLMAPPVADELPPDARWLRSVDPEGAIAHAVPLGQVLGGVVHLACSSPSPGVVHHGMGDRLIVGEPASGDSERARRAAAALAQAGFRVECSPDIRREVWYKLWGNMTMNPVSALTGATCDRILDDELVRAFMSRAMGEAAAIGERIGCPITQGAEERMALTRQLGAFKTSMLQDAEAGRPLELDALVGAVCEIGQRVQVRTPAIDALLGLTRLMAATRGLQGKP